MKCKPGLNAIVVKAYSPVNNGKIVKIVCAYTPGTLYDGLLWIDTGEPQWIVDTLGGPLISLDVHNVETAHQSRPFPQSQLIPLIDDEDEDQIIRVEELETVD
jgi:hypothetical protein